VNAEPLIAVVDDDSGMRSSLDGLVRSLGYRVSAFSCAEDLLASLALKEARCVISDVEMPGGMDGISLAKCLVDANGRRPVILISAFVNEKVEADAAAAGAFALLKKPFVGEALIESIERALAG
jgi:FixJ family two-component response regulator